MLFISNFSVCTTDLAEELRVPMKQKLLLSIKTKFLSRETNSLGLHMNPLMHQFLLALNITEVVSFDFKTKLLRKWALMIGVSKSQAYQGFGLSQPLKLEYKSETRSPQEECLVYHQAGTIADPSLQVQIKQ